MDCMIQWVFWGVVDWPVVSRDFLHIRKKWDGIQQCLLLQRTETSLVHPSECLNRALIICMFGLVAGHGPGMPVAEIVLAVCVDTTCG